MTTTPPNPGDDTLSAAADLLSTATTEEGNAVCAPGDGSDELPSTFPCLVQNGEEGHVQLGLPSSDGRKYTIGGAGCLLTCFTMIVNFLLGTKYTVAEMNKILVDAGCFSGPLIILEKAAAHMGLKALDSERSRSTTADRDASIMARAIRIIFGQGRLCILHVDLNHNKPGGDVYGDHFVVAFELVPGNPAFDVGDVVKCADPAPGKVFEIDVASGLGDSTWVPAHTMKDPATGKTVSVPAVVEHMTVVGVIPISKATA